MPPRKAATDENTAADPPRRSGRIALLPATAAEANPKPKARTTKKRTAGDEAKDGEGSTAKKVTPTFLFFFSIPFFFGGVIYINTTILLQAKADPESAEGGDSNALSFIDIDGVLPDLTLKNEKGEDIQIANLASEKGVILFLVPKADTRASKKKTPKSTIILIPFFFPVLT